MPNPGNPTHLAVVSGAERPASSRSTRLDADALAETPPKWLDAEAKREWRRIVRYASAKPGWLETADRALLAMYCTWWSTFVAAAKDVNERGPLVAGRSSADAAREDGGALVKNRAVSVMSDATTQLRQIAASLGLSTWHRERLGSAGGTGPAPGDAGAGDDLLTG